MTCVSPSWPLSPKTPILERDEIHVWRTSLDLPASRMQTLQQTLTADEQARAGRFYFPRHRAHFIAARGVLRDILSRYLNREANQLCFCYNAYGKPSLVGDFDGGLLCFNVSHSHGLALYAVTHRRAVGIDVEHICSDFANEQIAERFFSPREVVALRALPSHLQTDAFFNCWTRKEAYIKAKGKGLSIPLHGFDVSLAPGEPAALLRTQWDSQEVTRWSLQELNPGSGYVGAVAVEARDWQLKCWQWRAAL